MQRFEVRDQAKTTCLQKFGVDNPLKIKEFHEMGILAASSSEAREKARQSYLAHYGVENPLQSEAIKEKCKQTCLERYGVPFPLQNEEILQKNNRSRKKTVIILHWKTKKELVCTASYELAFVSWCNVNQIDFDWQIKHLMPDGRVYFVDAYIKSGEFKNTWIEIKGWFPPNRREKWEWFNTLYPNNSQLWNFKKLKELKIL